MLHVRHEFIKCISIFLFLKKYVRIQPHLLHLKKKLIFYWHFVNDNSILFFTNMCVFNTNDYCFVLLLKRIAKQRKAVDIILNQIACNL